MMRRNHGEELPYDTWIPVHAVKFNDDGTTELMIEGGSHNPIANVADGFVDAAGRFHPIRWATDYDRHRLQTRKEGYYYDIHPSAQYWGRHKPEHEVRKHIASRKKPKRRAAN